MMNNKGRPVDDIDYTSPPRKVSRTLACLDPAEIAGMRAKIERLQSALEWIVENADPQKAPLIVGRAKAALRP
jgi:hypothetical protein